MAKSWTPTNFQNPTDRGGGGWVKSPDMAPDDGGRRANGANGMFIHNGQMVGLWVNDISIGFEMGGTQGQSKERRSFFPRNFVQPTFQIAGQMPNTHQYNRLAQFVRQSQLDLMAGRDLDSTGIGVQFVLSYTGNDPYDHDRAQRGAHSNLSVMGYILSAPAGAERFVNAPGFSLTFTVTQFRNFLGRTDSGSGPPILQSPDALIFNQKFFDPSTLKPVPQPKSTRLSPKSKERPRTGRRAPQGPPIKSTPETRLGKKALTQNANPFAPFV